MVKEGYNTGSSNFIQKVLYSLVSYWNVYYNGHCDQLFNEITYQMLYKFQDSFADELDARFNPIGSLNAEQTLDLMEENPMMSKKRDDSSKLYECLTISLKEVNKLR